MFVTHVVYPQNIFFFFLDPGQTKVHHFITGLLPILRQTTRGKRLYHLPTLRALLGVGNDEYQQQQEKKIGVIYARVSSTHQKTAGDLQRQIDDLIAVFPSHKVISDVGSGLNYKRPGFKTLLEQVHAGMVQQVVVRHKDRLCRYGLELVEWILAKAGTQLVVLSDATGTCPPDATRELADDLLAITTVFVARHNGQRSAANRRRRHRLHQTTASTSENAQSQGVSDTGPVQPAQAVAGSGQMDLQPMCGSTTTTSMPSQQEGAASPVRQPRSPASPRSPMGSGCPVRRSRRGHGRRPQSHQSQ